MKIGESVAISAKKHKEQACAERTKHRHSVSSALAAELVGWDENDADPGQRVRSINFGI
jgi:hypothetical protein